MANGGSTFEPEGHSTFRVVVITVLVALLASGATWWFFKGRTCPEATAPVSTTVAPQIAAPAKQVSATSNCPPRDMLTDTRAARIRDAEMQIDAYAKKHHWVTTEQVALMKQRVHDDPDGDLSGDSHKIGGDTVEVWWKIKAKQGTDDIVIPLHTISRCICTVHTTVYVPPPRVPKRYTPPPPKKAWMPPPIPLRKEPGCFAYRVDGRGYPVKMPLEAVISFYQHGGGLDDFYKAMNSKCFYAVDGGTGERLYLDRGCFICQDGEEQSAYPFDVRVGTKATLVVTVRSASGKIGFPSGYGIVYLPVEWVEETSVLWCFTAIEPYYGEEGGGAVSLDYFDRVSLDSVLPDIPRHKYHRVIKPDGKVYGPGFKPGRP